MGLRLLYEKIILSVWGPSLYDKDDPRPDRASLILDPTEHWVGPKLPPQVKMIHPKCNPKSQKKYIKSYHKKSDHDH